MSEEYWSAVRTVRLRVVDMLDTLSATEWDAASLCEGWRVRDVAGHLALVSTITTGPDDRGRTTRPVRGNRINTLLAVRAGSVPTSEIVQKLRDHAGDRTTAKALDTRNSLFDAIVHSQDIAIPLGRTFPIPVGSAPGARPSLGHGLALQRPSPPRRAKADSHRHRLVCGIRAQISGSALSLLLLLTGRITTARSELVGAGLEGLPA